MFHHSKHQVIFTCLSRNNAENGFKFDLIWSQCQSLVRCSVSAPAIWIAVKRFMVWLRLGKIHPAISLHTKKLLILILRLTPTHPQSNMKCVIPSVWHHEDQIDYIDTSLAVYGGACRKINDNLNTMWGGAHANEFYSPISRARYQPSNAKFIASYNKLMSSCYSIEWHSSFMIALQIQSVHICSVDHTAIGKYRRVCVTILKNDANA